MRLKESLILKRDLMNAINLYESQGEVLPNCVDELKEFMHLFDQPDFVSIVGDDPDTPCWKLI